MRQMMSNDVTHRRFITRSKVAIEEVSSVAQVPSSTSEASLSDTTSHLHKNTQVLVNECSLSTQENSSARTKKGGRGASTGKSIEKAIVENDGKLLEIEFPEGFKKPRRFANHLANGIGIVIRHSPELDCTSQWSDIPEYHKLPVYAGLDAWFVIQEWGTNPIVKMYMDDMFQRSYTHWRGRLSASYKGMIIAKRNPKTHCPFDWIPIQKWSTLCDYYGSDKFQKRSQTNANNRSLLPYTHTSGSKSFHTRFIQMENQSYVDTFALTHMKDGIFVNEKAAAIHVEMENLRNEPHENSGNSTSEREIIKKVLGKRSGYEKGLGYGVVPSKCTKRSASDTSHLETLKEKLSGTENELRDATSQMKSQQEMIESQEVLIQNYDDRCQKQDEEIQVLRDGQNEMKQMLLTLMQQNSPREF